MYYYDDWFDDAYEPDYDHEGQDEHEMMADEVDDYEADEARESWSNEDADAIALNIWAPLQVGECRMYVSSLGAIQLLDAPFQSVDYGISLAGTPNRTVRIEVSDGDFRNFMVHELVWQAFNGDIPDGWEVRHKTSALQDMTAACEASNALDDIDIYPALQTRLKHWMSK